MKELFEELDTSGDGQIGGPEAIAFYIRNGETSGNASGAFRIVLEWEEAQA